jgi:hypothetical protein
MTFFNSEGMEQVDQPYVWNGSPTSGHKAMENRKCFDCFLRYILLHTGSYPPTHLLRLLETEALIMFFSSHIAIEQDKRTLCCQ